MCIVVECNENNTQSFVVPLDLLVLQPFFFFYFQHSLLPPPTITYHHQRWNNRRWWYLNDSTTIQQPFICMYGNHLQAPAHVICHHYYHVSSNRPTTTTLPLTVQLLLHQDITPSSSNNNNNSCDHYSNAFHPFYHYNQPTKPPTSHTRCLCHLLMSVSCWLMDGLRNESQLGQIICSWLKI